MILKRIIIREVKIIFERLDAFRLASRGEYHNNRVEIKFIERDLFEDSHNGFYTDKRKLSLDKEKVTRDINTAFDKIKFAKM